MMLSLFFYFSLFHLHSQNAGSLDEATPGK